MTEHAFVFMNLHTHTKLVQSKESVRCKVSAKANGRAPYYYEYKGKLVITVPELSDGIHDTLNEETKRKVCDRFKRYHWHAPSVLEAK